MPAEAQSPSETKRRTTAEPSPEAQIQELRKGLSEVEADLARAKTKRSPAPPPAATRASTTRPITANREPVIVAVPVHEPVAKATASGNTKTQRIKKPSAPPPARENKKSSSVTKGKSTPVIKAVPVSTPSPVPIPQEPLALATVDDFDLPAGPSQSGLPSTRSPMAAPHAVEVSPAPPSAPLASKANKPGFVISPFPPHKLIDATGMDAGTIVKDPDTGAIFRLPDDMIEVEVVQAPAN